MVGKKEKQGFKAMFKRMLASRLAAGIAAALAALLLLVIVGLGLSLIHILHQRTVFILSLRYLYLNTSAILEYLKACTLFMTS